MKTHAELAFLLSLLPPEKGVKKNQLYHILSGKRTASNLYTAKTLNLIPIFGLKETMSRREYDAQFTKWLGSGWIVAQDDAYVPTPFALTLLENAEATDFFPQYMNIGRFGHAVELFWARMQLLVQVVSHQAYGATGYIPIVGDRDVQVWVKEWVRSHKNTPHFPTTFGQEWLQTLSFLPSKHAQLITSALSGYEKIGTTSRQRSFLLGVDRQRADLEFIEALHHFYRVCRKQPNCPYLYQLAREADHATFEGVTQSTYATIQLVKQNKNPVEISRLRRLKENTIWEHLIEWVIIHPKQSFRTFIPPSIYTQTKQHLQDRPSISMTEVQQHIPDLIFPWFRLIQLEEEAKLDDTQNARRRVT